MPLASATRAYPVKFEALAKEPITAEGGVVPCQ